MATHDYVIDNSTGANVRADINNVLQAILTNNSSSSAPSTTAAYMFWADTTTGTLKIRNSSDNAWVELLQLDGTLTLEDGSASTPALAFRDDLDTGIFSSASNTFNIATGGVERVEFQTSEVVFNDGGVDCDFRIEGDTDTNLFKLDAGNDRVGIGTASPSTKFEVQTAAGERVQFLSNGSNEQPRIDLIRDSGTDYSILNAVGAYQIKKGSNLIYEYASDSHRFSIDGSEKARIDSSGKVGIGITNPVGRLHLHQADSGTIDALMITNSDTTNNGLTIGVNSNEQPFFFNGSNTDMFFGTNNTERMRIDSSGDVLIGTSTAVVDTKLVVAGNINQFNADTGTGASTKSYVLGRSYTMSTSSTNILTFNNWGTSAFDITVFRRDNASPAGAAVHKVYLAFKGSGLNMTQAAIAQEHKVAISGIHGITFTVSENNDTATLSVTGDDNGGETQDFTIYIMARGNGNGTIVVA